MSCSALSSVAPRGLHHDGRAFHALCLHWPSEGLLRWASTHARSSAAQSEAVGPNGVSGCWFSIFSTAPPTASPYMRAINRSWAQARAFILSAGGTRWTTAKLFYVCAACLLAVSTTLPSRLASTRTCCCGPPAGDCAIGLP